MNLEVILDSIYPLPKEAKELMNECIEKISLKKGHILLHSNKIEDNIYFIKRGIVRAYSYYDGNEITFWFGQEGHPVVSMNSYVNNQKGYEDIELLEDCQFYKIENSRLQDLYKKNIHIANWGRKLNGLALIEVEQRLISRLCKTASQRYQELLKDQPELLNRVKLGHIASYLGISQVSLSRIRAQIK